MGKIDLTFTTVNCSELTQHVYEGNYNQVSSLIDNLANINAIDSLSKTPLYWSIEKGYKKITELLVKNNAHYLKEKKSYELALKRSCFLGHLRIVENFLKMNEIPENEKSESLLVACENGQHEIALQLLEFGVDVNIKDEFNNTPLHYCAFYLDSRLLSILESYRPRFNEINSNGYSPLTVALFVDGRYKSERRDFISKLLKNNAVFSPTLNFKQKFLFNLGLWNFFQIPDFSLNSDKQS